jgi:hypothetical protein
VRRRFTFLFVALGLLALQGAVVRAAHARVAQRRPCIACAYEQADARLAGSSQSTGNAPRVLALRPVDDGAPVTSSTYSQPAIFLRNCSYRT